MRWLWLGGFLVLTCGYQNCSAPFSVRSASEGASVAPSSESTPAPTPGDEALNNQDPTQFFGASRCMGLLFCEDFESTTSEGRWGLFPLQQSTLDSSAVARGSMAWHLKGSGAEWKMVQNVFPIAGDMHYGRMFVYLNDVPLSAHVAFATAMEQPYSGTEGRIQMGAYQTGDYYLSFGSDGGPSGDWGATEGAELGALPKKKWICLEWMQNAATDEVRVWRDSVERLHLAKADFERLNPTHPFVVPHANYFYIGYRDYWVGSFDASIDEVAIDTKRIGCIR